MLLTAEHQMRRAAESRWRSRFHRVGQALARAQIKGDIGPAPIIDQKPQGGERFGLRARIYVLFLAVSDDRLAVDHAGTVLAADHVAHDRLRRERPEGLQHL